MINRSVKIHIYNIKLHFVRYDEDLLSIIYFSTEFNALNIYLLVFLLFYISKLL